MPCSASTCRLARSGSRASSPSSTGFPSTANTTYDSDPPSTEEYFKTLGDFTEKRLKLLVGVVQGFSEARGLTDGFYRHFWSGRQYLFRFPEVASDGSLLETLLETGVPYRLRRLKQIRQNIQKGDREANRLWFICLAHEVEHISKWGGIGGYTRKGVDRVSAAIEIVECYLGDLSKNLDIKKSRNILQIMKEGGPAAVLFDDGGQSPTV